MKKGSAIKVRLFRFDPCNDKEPYYDNITIAISGAVSAMNLVDMLHDMDPSLACRTSMCFRGICNSCAMRVNGKDVKGCETVICSGDEVIIEPHSGYEVVRDLVVDFRRPVCKEG